MADFSGMCVGGPCDGQMVQTQAPYYRVQVRMPAPVLYDERVYMADQPIGPTSVEYVHVPGIRFPTGYRIDFFVLRKQFNECNSKGSNPAFWAFSHILNEYQNTRVDT